MFYGVDTSWPQGDYIPTDADFVFIGVASADGGKLFEQSTWREQLANARAAGKEVGFYFFNGNVGPAACADYFWGLIKGVIQHGDAVALDVESSQGGTFPAWSVAQANTFAVQLAANRGLTTQASACGMYGPEYVMTRPGWGTVEKAGSWLWLAWPGAQTQIDLGEWSDWMIWQNTIASGIDRDIARRTLAQLSQSVPPTPPTQPSLEGEEEMSVPIYARGDQVDVWYALYTNARQSASQSTDSGAVYSGRRSVSAGERAIVTAYQAQTGFLHPDSGQTQVITIPQAVFDGINKFAGSL